MAKRMTAWQLEQQRHESAEHNYRSNAEAATERELIQMIGNYEIASRETERNARYMLASGLNEARWQQSTAIAIYREELRKRQTAKKSAA